jgi:hypothetical protein
MFGAQAAAGGAGFGGVFGRPKLERRIATMKGAVDIKVNGQDVEIKLRDSRAVVTFHPMAPALFGMNDLQDRIMRAKGPGTIKIVQGNLDMSMIAGSNIQFHP